MLLVAALLLASLCASTATAAPFREGVVLLTFRPGVSASQAHAIERLVGARAVRRLGPRLGTTPGALRGERLPVPLELHLATGSVPGAVDALRGSGLVAFAEPDYPMHASAVPNDPEFALQWGAENSGQEIPTQEAGEVLGSPAPGMPGADDGATRAWSVSTGSRAIVVGDVDTGVDYTHPDLAANIWTNPGGVGGCPAGSHGYNAVEQSCDPDDDDEAYGGHGTHVAGIIGAVGDNGVGVAGMNWQSTILPVKWLSSASSGNTSALIEALQWLLKAKEEGVNVRVVNDSATFEGPDSSEMLAAEIKALGEQSVLFVSAAGNTSDDNDSEPYERFPCDYQLANEICVTASNNNDQLPEWANYGAKTVDLAAPGVSIFSTLRDGGYGYLSGGSMAAAQVSGAAALILSVEPSLSPEELKADIVEHVDKLPSLTGKVASGGRLDVCKALPGCPSQVPAVVTGAADGITQSSATLNATVDPNGGAIEDCHFEYGPTPSYGASVACAAAPSSGDTPVAVSVTVTGLATGTTYYYRLAATNAAGTGYGAALTLATPPLSPSSSEPPNALTEAAPNLGILTSQEAKAPTPPDAVLARTSIRASSSGTILIELSCPATAISCVGTITLRRAAPSLTLASATFRGLGGHTLTIKLHLLPAARRLLAHSHTLRATATILAHEAVGPAHVTRTAVTIRHAP